MHFCAAADPANACVWSHRRPRAGHHYSYVFCHVTARICPRQLPYSEKWSSGQQCLARALVPFVMPTSHRRFYSQAAVRDMDLKIAWADTVGGGTALFPQGSCSEQRSLGLQFSLCTDPRICHSSPTVTFAPGNLLHKGHCTCSCTCNSTCNSLVLPSHGFSAPAAFFV